MCIAFAVVVLLTSHSNDIFSRFVRWLSVTKPVKLMADWTYGIYLYQMFAMAIAGWIMVNYMPADASKTEMLIWFVVLLCVFTLAITLVVFNFVEKPARAYGHKLAKKVTESARLKQEAGLNSPAVGDKEPLTGA